MSDELIRLDDAIALFDAPNIIEDLRALPAVSPGVKPEAETERVFMDAVWDVTGFRGTPEQLMNALSEMVRREPRQMQGAILRAALSAITAANARADAAEAALAADAWQPIETAPKDGTRIDLWCRRSWNPPVEFERRTSVYWCRTHQRFRAEGEFHYVEETFNPRPGERYLIPTHWRPLPAPPALIPKGGAK